MGPPRALKVCTCFIDDDDGFTSVGGAAADVDDNDWLRLFVLALQNLTLSSLTFSPAALLQLPWRKPSSSIDHTEFTCCTFAQQPLQAFVYFPKDHHHKSVPFANWAVPYLSDAGWYNCIEQHPPS